MCWSIDIINYNYKNQSSNGSGRRRSFTIYFVNCLGASITLYVQYKIF